MDAMSAWQLVDGDVTIAGDLVLRPARPWSATVHALLAHLRAHGLRCVPEPVGIRDDIEAVTFIPGDAGPEAWPHQVTDDGVASAAGLLRQVHDATRDFRPDAEAAWAFPPAPGADAVCHGDPGPWNFVWRDGRAVALIDWEHASPAPALDDVAAALDSFAPCRPDDVARGHGFAEPPDRRGRIRTFASAYGTGGTGRARRPDPRAPAGHRRPGARPRRTRLRALGVLDAVRRTGGPPGPGALDPGAPTPPGVKPGGPGTRWGVSATVCTVTHRE